jgi:cell division protein FtsQ
MRLSRSSTKNKKHMKTFKKLFCVLLLLTIFSIVYFINSDEKLLSNDAKRFITKHSKNIGFTLNEISVDTSGDYCVNLDKDPYLTQYLNQSTLLVPINEIRKYIESIDCAENAQIKRVLPDKLLITLKTKEAIAIWQHDKRFYFITDQGNVMNIRHLEGLEKFIIITGENAPSHTRDLLNMISIEQEIHSQIVSAIWVGNRRWNIKFANGAELMLPENNPELAWHKFVNVYKNSLEFHNWKYKTIDLRIEDKIYTR